MSPRTSRPRRHLLFVRILILGICVLAAGALEARPAVPHEASMAGQPALDPADPGHQPPLNVSAGGDDPESFHPEVPRRLDAPERQSAAFGPIQPPVPQPARTLWAGSAAIERLGGPAGSPSRHLRLCVFRC